MIENGGSHRSPSPLYPASRSDVQRGQEWNDQRQDRHSFRYDIVLKDGFHLTSEVLRSARDLSIVNFGVFKFRHFTPLLNRIFVSSLSKLHPQVPTHDIIVSQHGVFSNSWLSIAATAYSGTSSIETHRDQPLNS